MKVGTKSLLFGVHQVFIHPFWVALSWWKLYGFPFDPRLWMAFIVHDWGYWGCPEMDGEVGDYHPVVGAEIMHRLFDRGGSYLWYDFCVGHSRFLAKQYGRQPSRLCMADKLSLGLEPWWLYLPRAWASGELKEYMRSAQPDGKHGHMNLKQVTAKEWYLSVQKYLRRYVEEHRDGKEDVVTQVAQSARYAGKSGV
jgi:hypothetical protein